MAAKVRRKAKSYDVAADIDEQYSTERGMACEERLVAKALRLAVDVLDPSAQTVERMAFAAYCAEDRGWHRDGFPWHPKWPGHECAHPNHGEALDKESRREACDSMRAALSALVADVAAPKCAPMFDALNTKLAIKRCVCGAIIAESDPGCGGKGCAAPMKETAANG